MSNNTIVISVIAVISTLVLFIAATSFWRFYKEGQEKLQQELEQLSKRCHRISDLLLLLPDRYLPLTTKMMLVEYLITSITYLEKHKQARELSAALAGYLQLLEELKNGQQATLNDKVQTHLQLAHVQQGLESIPLLLRGLVSQNLIDKVIAKEQVSQIRFFYALAHHDLLVKEALSSLDLDKKARALEKLRHALAEMEKVASYDQSEPVIKKLNNTIERIETELFGKNSRAD